MLVAQNNRKKSPLKLSTLTIRAGEELTLCRYSRAFILSSMEFFAVLATVATPTRLERATSSVTGWHSNQLNYGAI